MSQVIFEKKLARWAANNNIKRNAITSLLHILKENRYPDLPCDSRTLLKTPRQVVIQDMPPGKYIYIGLKMYLENICSSLKVIPKCLELDLNIDGAPIFHNSFENGCIWPILGRIKNLNSSVFAIAIYGLSCCPKCHIVGKRIENRSAFPSHIAQLRTNEEFRDKVDEEFHHGICEFEKIEELDMINNFPIDYMHACLHGIMKKLFGFVVWFWNKKEAII
ncbi:hypothetical protein PVAND_002246 [Polypedilum vanderplanki]|uniref:Uncharacterized protein n=1 Tax=Polypedilum vanderplanki TaxID=319348 RepID=A0A9J6BRM1_POLVA|nr:hypothetical protein PVAND_002246 [Polypedilum vanderplanki]